MADALPLVSRLSRLVLCLLHNARARISPNPCPPRPSIVQGTAVSLAVANMAAVRFSLLCTLFRLSGCRPVQELTYRRCTLLFAAVYPFLSRRLAKERARLKKQEKEGRMQPDPEIVKGLLDMSFSENVCSRALPQSL